jgi:hypothetical protein
VGDGIGPANAVTVNMNGRQTLSPVAYAPETVNIKVNTFGADNMDIGDRDFGWPLGIFAAGEEIKESAAEEAKAVFDAITGNSTVNILGTELGSDWYADGEDDDAKATATFGCDQGLSCYGSKPQFASYARAFALGNDFQI